MAKLSAELVVVFALLFVSHLVMAHRTTITTIEYEEEQRQGESRHTKACREEIEKQDLHHCERYLATRHSRPGGSVVEEVTDGPSMHRRSCCHQLRQMDEGCRCQEIRMIVREQQREYAGEEMEEIVRAARDLPSVCRVAPQRCEIRAVWY
ncbi:hypothetical protein MLD38_035243 [Melastoma candidum]|uniref:Uncharacterized protein n=1 Tax=Melastoma candidum TaxID=119954 RepID=A0ACB9MFN7_9MYRT|nr:hypothetical protein MLD38_035243 [Melastoma candidum]